MNSLRDPVESCVIRQRRQYGTSWAGKKTFVNFGRKSERDKEIDQIHNEYDESEYVAEPGHLLRSADQQLHTLFQRPSPSNVDFDSQHDSI